VTLALDRLNTFEAAAAVWRDVLHADPHSSFFSSPAWLETWWAHHEAGRELLLLVARRDQLPVGLAPLMLEPVPGGRSVQFLGTGLSDYADFLVDEGRASRRDVVFAVLDHLAATFSDALFDLQEIPETSPSLPLIEEWLRRRGLPYSRAVQDVCPIISLPEAPELYHKQLKKSFLADLRRGDRRLRERGEVIIKDHVQPEQGCDWYSLRDQMSDLQSQRMRTKGEVPLWQGPLGAFVKDVLAAADMADQLRLTALYLDGKMIAYELCFLHKKTIYAWSRAFDEEHKNAGPGKIALLHLLETAITQGYQVFDLLRGAEPYKDLWTNAQVKNARVTFVVKPSVGALLQFKYRTAWKEKLQSVEILRKANRLIKSLRGGK